ncbi:MAG: hypothetical protein HN336_05950 [Lentimicrobiaceae bacterium]|jgi:cell fate regulator YaaT (PSP1 superfamily)|nr:hypothetical protein [Lentimicrobiaceae bacterium]MCP4909928.1 hypothetical protein [Bacteroidota bacterium]MBT3454933.1 hypothetical protein [Lentimicrobiaceae bacterium]MBT3818441.1 hypothetical protein [Lentimicrobiaceae bacterium]MBT4060809.1 hypothetical protein [Lentimicrobiaceae bacterium]
MDEIINPTIIQNSIRNSRGCCAMKGTNPDDLSINQASCCKLSSIDWLSDYTDGNSVNNINVVEVRFKNGRKDFYTHAPDIILKKGEVVAVEASPGHDIGIITLAGQLVEAQMKRKNVDISTKDLKKVFRHARTTDIEKWFEVMAMEDKIMLKSRTIAADLHLEMKINDVEYQGDKTKAIFYYTANDRVDFRELIRKLADSFRVRIEMKQIGARQEAAKVGGIGSCGRETCCSSYMSSFSSVSTTSARAQQLSLNPQKLAGLCGKLKCCLNYEVDDYVDTMKAFPDSSIPLRTKKGKAYFIKNEILKKTMWYAYEGDSHNMMSLPIDKVKYIIEQNNSGKLPAELEKFAEKNTQVEAVNDSMSDDISGYA